jgi:hypothetical protein
MKKISIAALLVVIWMGCTDQKSQKKAILDEVLSVHDKVMGAEGQLVKNKMQLDTLIKKQNLSAKDTAFILRAKLMAADSVMDTWMHNFDYEQKGKSNDETIAYMKIQKKKIMEVDSQINQAVAEANKYLVKVKSK